MNLFKSKKPKLDEPVVSNKPKTKYSRGDILGMIGTGFVALGLGLTNAEPKKNDLIGLLQAVTSKALENITNRDTQLIFDYSMDNNLMVEVVKKIVENNTELFFKLIQQLKAIPLVPPNTLIGSALRKIQDFTKDKQLSRDNLAVVISESFDLFTSLINSLLETTVSIAGEHGKFEEEVTTNWYKYLLDNINEPSFDLSNTKNLHQITKINKNNNPNQSNSDNLLNPLHILGIQYFINQISLDVTSLEVNGSFGIDTNNFIIALKSALPDKQTFIISSAFNFGNILAQIKFYKPAQLLILTKDDFPDQNITFPTEIEVNLPEDFINLYLTGTNQNGTQNYYNSDTNKFFFSYMHKTGEPDANANFEVKRLKITIKKGMSLADAQQELDVLIKTKIDDFLETKIKSNDELIEYNSNLKKYQAHGIKLNEAESMANNDILNNRIKKLIASGLFVLNEFISPHQQDLYIEPYDSPDKFKNFAEFNKVCNSFKNLFFIHAGGNNSDITGKDIKYPGNGIVVTAVSKVGKEVFNRRGRIGTLGAEIHFLDEDFGYDNDLFSTSECVGILSAFSRIILEKSPTLKPYKIKRIILELCCTTEDIFDYSTRPLYGKSEDIKLNQVKVFKPNKALEIMRLSTEELFKRLDFFKQVNH